MSKAEQILMIAIICYKNAQKYFKKQMKIADIKQENEKLKQALEKIREEWNEFKKLSPLEISFNQKQVYELDKAINNEVLK